MVAPPTEFERRGPTPLWDTLIRVGLIVALGFLCFQVLSPFLRLIVWSIIPAVTIYPLHQRIARLLGGRQKLASTLLVNTRRSCRELPTAAQFLTPSRGAGNLQSVVMTVLALGYEIMKHWVAATPESASAKSPAEPVKAQVASAAKARDDPIPRVLVKTLCLCGG